MTEGRRDLKTEKKQGWSEKHRITRKLNSLNVTGGFCQQKFQWKHFSVRRGMDGFEEAEAANVDYYYVDTLKLRM